MMKEVKAVRDSAIESYVSTLTTQELKNFAEMCTGSDWDCFPVEFVESVVVEILKGIKYNDPGFYMVSLKDDINDILFDPCGSYHEFNKLTEKSNVK